MRWFFLAFIALLAAAGNAAIFESFSAGRVADGLAFNLFVFSLLVIWRAAYFAEEQAKARLFVLGHAMLTLAAGIGIVIIGTGVVLSSSCESLMFGNKNISQVVLYLQSYGYCRGLGLAVVIFGLFMAYPSVRFFIGIAPRFRGLLKN